MDSERERESEGPADPRGADPPVASGGLCGVAGGGSPSRGLICLILASGAARHLPAHLPDTRQRSRATPAWSSA